MKIVFVDLARREFINAISYYNDRQAGLGIRFKHEVDDHIKWIAENAEIPRLLHRKFRRINLKIFPY